MSIRLLRFSIIIPVYNVEKYLRQCIESVLKQNFKGIELILINDGSTDSSGNICEEYAEKENCIKVIQKINSGPADSRNEGILLANGDFLIFLDSDDFLEDECLIEISDIIEQKPKVDVILCRINRFFEQIGKKKPIFSEYDRLKIDSQTSINILLYLFGPTKGSFWSASNHIYNRNFILNNNFFFRKNIYFEDMLWTPRVLLKASTFSFFQKPYLNYRQKRVGSRDTSLNPQKEMDLFTVCAEWIKCINTNEKMDASQKTFFVGQFTEFYLWWGWRSIYYYKKTDRKILFESVRKQYQLLNYANTRKSRIIACSYYCLGLRITGLWLNLFWRFICFLKKKTGKI